MGLRSLPFFKAKKGWQFAGGGLSADGGGGGGSLPIATTDTLGAVRVGSGLNVAIDGTLSSAVALFSLTKIDTGLKYNNKTVYLQSFYVTGSSQQISTNVGANLTILQANVVYNIGSGTSRQPSYWTYTRSNGNFMVNGGESSGKPSFFATLIFIED